MAGPKAKVVSLKEKLKALRHHTEMHGQTIRPMLMSDGRPNGGGLGSRARDHHEPELLRPKKLLKRSEREASLDVVRAFADDVIR